MKISFIVPIYKVSAYIDQCVNSLISQTYTDLEIILVDDGSPDNCPRLCDLWANKDSRIRVFHKENGGLSDARNFGIQHSVGEYVVFVDGDDFWSNKTSLERLVSKALNNTESDFIGFNCEYYYPKSDTYTKWVPYADTLSTATEKNRVTCELVKSGTFPMSACLKMVKREFLLENNLFFVKGQIAEDIPWFINVLDKCSKCNFVNEYVYAYRQNVKGSISNTNGDKSFKSLFNIFKTELSKIDTRSFNDEAKEAIRSFLAYEYSILLTYKISHKTRKELYKYKDILSYTINPKVKMVSRVYNLFGIHVTEYVLKLYQLKRKAKK